MNWITTSGRTLDEAKSNALDQLGIVADDAEFDVVNDVEKGLFGRVKTDAKIRARVRPKQPVQKDERRNRNGNSGGRNRNRNRKKGAGGGENKQNDGRQSKQADNGRSNNQASKRQDSNNQNSNNQDSKTSQKGGNRPRNSGARQKAKHQGNNSQPNKNDTGATAAPKQAKKEKMETTISREEQESVAQAFLEGVLSSFSMTGSVNVVEEAADDDAIELSVTGDELGLLVGQKGVTLSALQELTRTVVQRNAEGAKTDRLRVDVAGYRARRTAALREFAQGIAQEVADSGVEKLLEPMGPADRKVVHDAVNDIDGVETGSEGEEPRRRVVIRAAG